MSYLWRPNIVLTSRYEKESVSCVHDSFNLTEDTSTHLFTSLMVNIKI